MSDDDRIKRLGDDLRTLETLRDESTIFDFVAASGEPPNKFTLIFHGKGLRRDRNAPEGYAVVDEHRCELAMGYGYPASPPELRWLTPAYHPNITYSGFISLKDLGVPWDKAVGVDVICERLWDTARMAYFDLNRASNYNAKNWLETEANVELPLDSRPLRDGPSEDIQAGSNVVRYRRRKPGDDAMEPRIPMAQPNVSSKDVFFIGEESTAQIRFASPVRNRQTTSNDDDIFYIE